MNRIETIMIIDDDEVNNFICSRIIEKADFTDKIHTFTGAVEGLAYLEKAIDGVEGDIPDLILLDLNMPVKNGWEFLDEFKLFSHRAEKQIVLIVFSSSVYQEDIDRANSYEIVSGYRSKPITLPILNQIRTEFFD